MSKLSLPEKKRNIVLVGHMGSGKTTVGKELAKRTQLKFYDIDKEIEKIAKKTINKIFEHDGEAKFRKLEEKVSMQILEAKESVIALGGGAFQSNAIRQKSIKESICIWLKLDIKLSLSHISNGSCCSFATTLLGKIVKFRLIRIKLMLYNDLNLKMCHLNIVFSFSRIF